jgi:predicted enzyme related to lactoylglutathione lyase
MVHGRPPRKTSLSDAQTLFAMVPVKDFRAAVAWYGRLFGRPADAIVNDEELMWKVTPTAWLYLMYDEEHAGKALVALAVPNLDKTLTDIRRRGIPCGTIELLGDAGRKATLNDIEGNTVSLVQVAG